MSRRPLLRRIARALGALGAALLLLLAVLVGNALRKSPPPEAALPPPPPPAVAAEVVAQHLAAFVRLPTVSHEDPRANDPSALAALRALLEATYPRVHQAMTREIIGDGALLYTWKGSDPSLPPALFAAHQDVVPVEPGTEQAWEQPPFSGAIESGFVWGRGAIDDKGSLVCLLEAAESLLAEGFAPRRTILFAFGDDEEVGGQGAKGIAAALAARGTRLAYALDEGLMVTEGVLPEVPRPVALIGLSEKGFVSVELLVEGEGGHSSMPPPETNISILAAAIDRLSRAPMPARLTGAARAGAEGLAPYLSFGQRVALQNLWLLEPIVLSSMAKKPLTNASIRTTTAPTIVEAGVKENVLPSRARAVVNFRTLPGDSAEVVLAHVRGVIGDPRVKARTVERSLSEAAPDAPMDSPAYQRIERAIRRHYPGSVVVPGRVLGATDGRRYTSIADGVYRFVPLVLREGDRERVHGTNERVRVADLGTAVSVYRALFQEE